MFNVSAYRRLWFLLGLGNSLQILFSLSLSELFVAVVGPFWLVSDWVSVRKHGISRLFAVSCLPFVGCVLSCCVNHTPIEYAIRGLATTYLIPCAIIVAHRLLWRDMNGYKWYFLGMAISLILCTFVLQKYGELTTYGRTGNSSVEGIMSGPLFWIQRLGAFVTLPGRGWYLTAPVALSLGAPIFMACFSLLITSSGRSAALGALFQLPILIIGGRTRLSMRRFSRCLYWVAMFGALAVVGLNMAYRVAATNGWLGEDSRRKYELQTGTGTGVIDVLLGGRAESIVGLLAVRDRPIFGYGPWAVDDKGYFEEFLSKYGTRESYQMYVGALMQMRKAGLWGERLIECHSYLVEFWVWFGLLGASFWIYVVFLLVRYLRQDCAAVPQWFFWLASTVPSMFWAICFSPYIDRIAVPVYLVACLVARAVRMGRMHLPDEMQREINCREQRGRR